MQSGVKGGLRSLVAAALCMCSTPLLAEELILRCDGSRGTVSFSVLLDPVKRTVLNIGFGTKIETEEFSETVIVAIDKESATNQNLTIDRVTGQFQLTWPPSNGGDSGGNYLGKCAPARRLF
jgi:hypothetical protein